MATVWKSASTNKRARAAGLWLVVPAALALTAASAPAALHLDQVSGHLAVGYGRAFIPGSPAGSISVSAGADYALTGAFGLGAELGYDLLGGRDVKRPPLYGSVDYSAFEASLRLAWSPNGLGPIHRVSVGPALFAAKGEVQTPFGGLALDDLSVHEVAPAAALDVTILPARMRPVRMGLEAGTRVAFLSSRTWTLASLRLAFHY